MCANIVHADMTYTENKQANNRRHNSHCDGLLYKSDKKWLPELPMAIQSHLDTRTEPDPGRIVTGDVKIINALGYGLSSFPHCLLWLIVLIYKISQSHSVNL